MKMEDTVYRQNATSNARVNWQFSEASFWKTDNGQLIADGQR